MRIRNGNVLCFRIGNLNIKSNFILTFTSLLTPSRPVMKLLLQAGLPPIYEKGASRRLERN